jgi:poly(beta-D-mannuronate) lyase
MESGKTKAKPCRYGLSLLLGMALTGAPLLAGVIQIQNLAELEEALQEVEAGTCIQLAAGEWNGVDVTIRANGTADQPVILEAEVPGSAKLTGPTSIRLEGAYITLRGLHFKGATRAEGREALISFRSEPDKTASNCRLTDLYFDHCNPDDPLENYPWIRVYGNNSRIDHCRFEGQDHLGRAIQVRVYKTDAGHRIDHNHFLDRLPGEKSNGYEVIQIGLSKDSLKAGDVLVERNIFERCDGETEIISSKSWGNIIRNNLFLECSGTVTLRHGDRGVVTGNAFLGNGKPGSGGVRVVGAGHVVSGNYFSGLSGRTGGVVVLYCGIPDSPLNGYFAAHDTLVEDNIFHGNSGNSIYLTGGYGARNRVILPEKVRIEGNLFGLPSGSGVVAMAGNLPGLQLTRNRFAAGVETGIVAPEGLSLAAVEFRPTENGLLGPFPVDGDTVTGQPLLAPPAVPQREEVGPAW